MKSGLSQGVEKNAKSRGSYLACTLIALLTLLVFWPVRTFEFQSYDDQRYVAANAAIKDGLTAQGIVWAFTTFHVSNWHPLTWLSHMLDVQLFGFNAGAHHFTSLCFHLANTLLLLLVLKQMTGAVWRSAFVAALFALHPTHVESVAWVAERKDVLSAFFFMLTLWAYTLYVERGEGRRAKGEGTETQSFHLPTAVYYWCSVIFFALGLLSKPMLVTVPFVLLLLDYWPFRRFQLTTYESGIKDFLPFLVEKIPFFLLAIGSSVVTFLAQRSGGSVASLQVFSIEERLANALAAYAGYLEKLFWPFDLAVLYLPPQQWSSGYIAAAALVLVGITLLLIWRREKFPYLAVGWFWFLGTLVPVIGLVQVGSQYMADRYTYIPYIGCFIGLAWGGWELAKELVSFTARPRSREALTKQAARAVEDSSTQHLLVGKTVLWTVALLLFGAAGLRARNQLEFWRTPESLFRHCIEVTTNNYVGYNNLGAILVNQHRYEEAKGFYTEALRINPAFPDAVMNMGTLLALQGDLTNAIQYLQRAVQLSPDSAEAYGKLGVALSQQGRTADAVSCYRESVRLKPDQVPACNNLAWLLATYPDAQLRNGPEAVRLAEHACELTAYKQPMLIGTLAAAYAEAGRFSDATNAACKAIALASAASSAELADKNRKLLELYRSGQAYHEAEHP